MRIKCGCLFQKYILSLTCLVFTPLTYASTPYAGGALLEIVSQMPEGTWRQVNTNSYSEAWTPAALRPLYGLGNPTPHKIIAAWSSFAWDSNRGDLILYGGGHANYSGNDIYRWRSRDLKWERVSLPSEIDIISSITIPVDGADAAPASAHTYDNAVFLPIVDRYLNFGGAIFNTGGAYVRPSEDNPNIMRPTGPYLFDPARADPNKVGGTTGSHVQRVSAFPEIEGGEMWENRDIPRHLPGAPIPMSHVNGCTAYSLESGYDVVYVAARIGGGTGQNLYRYQITDINTPWMDQITRVGIYWSSPSDQTSCGYDPVGKVFLKLGSNTNPFYFWDLRPERQTNRDQAVAKTGSVGEFVAWLNNFNSTTGLSLRYCALDFDPNRSNFLLWCGGAEVWRIAPPEQLSTSGWQVWMERLRMSEPSPPLNVGTGILGKWKYISGFDVFIGLENAVNGNIWVYKPIGWVAPSGGGSTPDPGPGPVNQAPAVVLSTPATGETVTVNSLVTLTAQASDIDGSVAEVIFYINGSAIGSVTTEPYFIDWVALESGEYAITAKAIDNMGASSVYSEPVTLIVQSDTAPPSSGEVVTTVIYRDSNENAQAVADTYLSIYHVNNNFGNAQYMQFLVKNYTPLIKFNIFASEGGPVPDNATIEMAALHLYKSEYSNLLALHAMMKPWKEREATWLRASNNLFWDSPGAAGSGSDYYATADAVINTDWNAGWASFNISERLKAFAEGEPNYGWRLVYLSGNVNGLIRFGSSERVPEIDIRPRLEVRWRM